MMVDRQKFDVMLSTLSEYVVDLRRLARIDRPIWRNRSVRWHDFAIDSCMFIGRWMIFS